MKLTGLFLLGFAGHALAQTCVSQEPQEGICLTADGGLEGVGCNGDNNPDVYPEGNCPPDGATESGDWFVVEIHGEDPICVQCADVPENKVPICNCGEAEGASDGPSGLSNANENGQENANENAGTGSGANGNGNGQGVGSNKGKGSGSN